MSDYLADTPNLGRAYCPTCEPTVDPFSEILDVRYCDQHQPARAGLDDAEQYQTWLTGSAEIDAETNRRMCDLLHRGVTPLRAMMCVAALLLLAGCAGMVPLNADLARITAADLDAAIVIAAAHGDTVGAGCYVALKKYLGTAPSLPVEIKGMFSALELARVGVGKMRAGVPSELHVACAPVVLDAEQTLLRLGIIGAGGLLR